MTTVGGAAAALAEFAPPQLAESWDNVGLLVGDPAASVTSILTCLDVTAAVLDEAARREAELLVAFHPLLFRPAGRVRKDDLATAEVWRLVREGRSLYATHTALDAARPGTSDYLAEALGVTVQGVLQPTAGAGDLKLVTFVPAGVVNEVAAALAAAGAGRLGAYAECSFRTPGQGTFRALAGAHPTVGEVGELETVDELRLEMVVPAQQTEAVTRALRAVHPYEEVAFDLYPLANRGAEVGLGRVGQLAGPCRLKEFAERVFEVTSARCPRWVGDPDRRVERVAVMGGSGASFLAAAQRAGADVLVTGDLKHHDALAAQRSDLAVVDPGHYATERFVVGATARWLAERFPSLRVTETAVDGEPFAGRLAC